MQHQAAATRPGDRGIRDIVESGPIRVEYVVGDDLPMVGIATHLLDGGLSMARYRLHGQMHRLARGFVPAARAIA